MKHNVRMLWLVTFLITGCQGQLDGPTKSAKSDYSRSTMVAAATKIVEGPGFASRSGGGGSNISDENSFYQEWHFLVSKDSFRENGGHPIEGTSLLWEVFQEYKSFLAQHIDVDQIPNMISKGGSNRFDANSTRYSYDFVSKDVTIGFIADWFRGGPKEPDSNSKEIQVSLRLRVN